MSKATKFSATSNDKKKSPKKSVRNKKEVVEMKNQLLAIQKEFTAFLSEVQEIKRNLQERKAKTSANENAKIQVNYSIVLASKFS